MPRKAAETTKAARAVFGRRLHKLREARGWSQEALADKAEVSQALLSSLESSVKQPGWGTVQRLADALEVGVQEFR